MSPFWNPTRRDVDFQVRTYAARRRARDIYDGHCHPFRLRGVKGWRRRRQRGGGAIALLAQGDPPR